MSKSWKSNNINEDFNRNDSMPFGGSDRLRGAVWQTNNQVRNNFQGQKLLTYRIPIPVNPLKSGTPVIYIECQGL